jgi:hypothetical protein
VKNSEGPHRLRKNLPPALTKKPQQIARKQPDLGIMNAEVKESFNQLSILDKYHRQSAEKQVEARIYLQMLSLLVKVYIERHGTTFIDDLSADVLANYF